MAARARSGLWHERAPREAPPLAYGWRAVWQSSCAGRFTQLISGSQRLRPGVCVPFNVYRMPIGGALLPVVLFFCIVLFIDDLFFLGVASMIVVMLFSP